jgi:hypothetical protein
MILTILYIVEEELVDYYDWMVDADHPHGIVVTDEMALIQAHPEVDDPYICIYIYIYIYLTLALRENTLF